MRVGLLCSTSAETWVPAVVSNTLVLTDIVTVTIGRLRCLCLISVIMLVIPVTGDL